MNYMFLLFVMFPLSLLGADLTGNLFIPAAHSKIDAANNFTLPTTWNEKDGVVSSNDVTTDNIELIRLSLKRKQARLFFPAKESLLYFLTYIVRKEDIVNATIKEQYASNHEKIFNQNTPLLTITDASQIPDSPYNKLLHVLQLSSNAVDPYNVDAFFEKVNHFLPHFIPSKTLPGARNTPNKSFLGRLKHALIFKYKTFKIPFEGWTHHQKTEYLDNSSYINFIDILPLGLLFSAIAYLSYKFHNYFTFKRSLFK